VCGRFGFLDNFDGLAESYPGLVGSQEQLITGRNLSPGEPRTVVIGTEEGPRLATPVWGLRLLALRRVLINVRVEGAASHGLFGPQLLHHRCVVPASYFFEWQKSRVARDQPSLPFVVMSKSSPLALGGILAPDRDGQVTTFGILTTEARSFLAGIHHRAPLLLRPEDLEAWLDPQVNTSAQLRELVKPYPVTDLTGYEIGLEVNDPRNQGEGMLAAVGPELGGERKAGTTAHVRLA
jgi:putative SOS response-associated peptidase YedK